MPTLIVSKLSLFLTSAMIFNSTIVSNNSFYSAELASFLAPVVGQMKSKWELCYNAHASSWDLGIFHRHCDYKNHTVTIIKRGTYIFGGYTDIPWGNFQFLFIYLKRQMMKNIWDKTRVLSQHNDKVILKWKNQRLQVGLL